MLENEREERKLAEERGTLIYTPPWEMRKLSDGEANTFISAGTKKRMLERLRCPLHTAFGTCDYLFVCQCACVCVCVYIYV